MTEIMLALVSWKAFEMPALSFTKKRKKIKKKEGAYKNALRKAPYIPSLSCFPQPGGRSGNELQVVHRV